VPESLLRFVVSTDRRAVDGLFDRPPGRDPVVVRRAARIVGEVRRRGDAALAAYAARLDGLDGPFAMTPGEIERGAAAVPAPVRAALARCARRIRAVAAGQVPRTRVTRVAPGVTIEERVVPLARVGCYVPGGRYPLPSSLLMTAIPARVAGVQEVIAVCPRPAPVVLAAALEAGVTGLFRIGGAHAVAALAYGTRSVPRVDKIVGPGNAYVAAAKALVATDCGIDFFAGPSEIAIVADDGNPDWIAADLVAQAEHDPDARAILLTASRRLATAVARRVAARAPRTGPARAALQRNGGIVLTRSLEEAVALASRLAPEHLSCDRATTAACVATAGTTFVGPFAVPAAGDYATGSNHVLPTAGAARFRGGLSAADFVRRTTVQRLTRAGLSGLARDALTLARAEGLAAHAASIEARLTR